MTKFVLVGGFTNKRDKNKGLFFKEVVKDIPKGGKILFCLFAKNKNEWGGIYKEYKKRFQGASPNKNLKYEIAEEDSFEEQLAQADVLHIKGGWTPTLIRKLKKYKNLEKLFKDKVISGSSAGVYALSKYCYSNDLKKILTGLGILKVKSYCHYKPQDTDIVKKLGKYKEELPMLLLPENRWIVLYQ